jgi:hypothetical protein
VERQPIPYRIGVRGLLATAALLATCLPRPAAGQCQLANPSFELPGSGGGTFAGWVQLDPVSASNTLVSHGHIAARAFGPNAGTWSVSGVAQQLDSAPGDRWALSARAGHSAADPLVGEARGIVNVEWRDANSGVISYETHIVIEPSTPTDVMHRVQFETGPAPAGTVKAVILLAKLQSPAHEPGSAYFDHIQFHSLTPPTIDDIQWLDFPGGRTIQFADRLWRVKGPGFYGPGPSLFADGQDHVWIDADDRLHMTIRNLGQNWYSTEVALDEPLVYGDYIFTTEGRLDALAPNVVLGLFIWQYPMCWDPSNPWNLHLEFDVEISRWGTPGNDVGQFVTQPWDYPGNIERFAVNFASNEQLTSFAFRLLPDRIEARSWYGGAYDEQPGTMVHTWTYTGPHIPMPEQQRVHINLWQFNGPPSNGQDQEAIIADFQFVPSCVDDPAGHDWRCFAACLSGPDVAILTSCGTFDGDVDGDVDLADFSDYQTAFTGP